MIRSIFFLTQFNNQTSFENIVKPKSLVEAARGRGLIGDRFYNLNWEEMHDFLGKDKSQLNRERQLMRDVSPVQTLWAYVEEENWNAAIKCLKLREGTNTKRIGYLSLRNGKKQVPGY